ncbi:MAG: hypothetical protein JNG83_06120 [Opitutaceae bacterium]|nr:hypothetical protein [Opitutaceae bacterium]
MRNRFHLLLLLAGLGLGAPAFAGADDPVSLVLTYRARPEHRADFRSWVETEGAAQFAQWRREGVFRDCLLLFTTFATANPDLVVVLDFARLADSGRWREIERRRPGGLTPEALRYAAPESASYGEAIAHGAAQRRDPARAAYLVITYAYTVDSATYRKYVAGYTVPQMEDWIASGALTAYALYLNHTPYNVPWESLLVLEYADLAGLARRDEIKAAARARLNAADPVFKSYADAKAEIRRDLAMFHADAIPLP